MANEIILNVFSAIGSRRGHRGWLLLELRRGDKAADAA
jgi:hypothetical protein